MKNGAVDGLEDRQPERQAQEDGRDERRPAPVVTIADRVVGPALPRAEPGEPAPASARSPRPASSRPRRPGRPERPTDGDQRRGSGSRIPSCGLMRAAIDREDRRPLRVVAPQLAQAEQQEDDADRVDLAPDDAVEPGDRVDDRDERARSRATLAPAAELEDHRPDEPADGQVGEDRRDLDQLRRRRRRVGLPDRARAATGRTGSPGV